MAAGTWITIDVKVSREASNEADPWVPPSASEVAAEIREVMEGVDYDTGWVITKVSASTLGGGLAR